MPVKSHGEIKHINGKRIATPEYRSWGMMRNRCLNPKAADYRYYGGRGIKLTKRWDKFENFLVDMGRRPSEAHSLDRIKVNGHYCKRNCRWATRAQQSQNRTDTRFSPTDIATIRTIYHTQNIKQKDLAKRYKTTQGAISQIVRGAAWFGLSGPIIANSNGRNRDSAGEKNNRAKVTDAQAIMIQKLYASGKFFQKELAKRFGLSQSQISKITLR